MIFRLSPLALAIGLCVPLPVASQGGGNTARLPELQMLSVTSGADVHVIAPLGLREIEISSSGGQTDVFLRFFDSAGADLADWTTLAQGSAMIVSICGAPVMTVENLSPMTTGTMYIPNLTFVQADALRGIWHGRDTCATLSPEVFPLAP